MRAPVLRATVALAAAGTMWSAGMPAALSGTAQQPEIVDPSGDANGVDGAAPGTVPPAPASANAWADITKAWVSTDHSVVPAKRDGQRGMLKVPEALRITIQTAGPIAPVGPGIVYAVEGKVNNCTYRFLAHVPGAWRDSKKALIAAECGPSSYALEVAPPAVNGNTISFRYDLGSDQYLQLYDGYSFGEVRAFTAPYHDWYWDYRYTSDTVGYLDHAPSDGNLAYFEIGSDLAPRFTPGLAYEPGSVTTVAGGSHGDGLPAPQASLYLPWGVSVGPDGLVYLADYGHSRIRRVASDGTIEPFAGFAWGFGGDGGHRLRALLHYPAGMSWGSDGTMVFADSVNHRVRAIGPDGIIRTIAGNGVRDFKGDGGPATKASLSWPQDVAMAPNGDVYVADLENNRIRRISAVDGKISTFAGGATVDGDNVPATQAALSPYGLAFDGEGDLWVSDYDRIREIDLETTIITNRVTGLGRPRGIAFDDAGNLYIADEQRGTVTRREPDGALSVIAGGGSEEPGDGGPATDARLHHAMDVDVDDAGNVYVAERTLIGEWSSNPVGHDRVRVVRPDGTIDTFAGTGHDKSKGLSKAEGVDFQQVQGVVYDEQGRLYIAESGSDAGVAVPASRSDGGRIWRLDPNGSIRVVAGNGEVGDDAANDDEGPALEVPIDYPVGIDVAPDGRVFFADAGSRQIKVYDPVARTVRVAAGRASGSVDGAPQPEVVDASAANLYFPRALAVAPNGDIYWSEASYSGCDPSRLRMLRDGKVHLVAGTIDVGANPVQCGFGGDGQPVAPGTTKLDVPEGLDVDADGNILIADSWNARVRRIDASSRKIDTVAGDGAIEHRDGTIGPLSSFAYPVDVEALPGGGMLVAERGLSATGYRGLHTGPRISHIAPNGMVSTVAGNGLFDLAQDDAARAASFLAPNAIAVSPQGHVAIADYHRVRVLTPDESGWPSPQREVRCLPNQPDTAGDARGRQTLNMHDTNNPAVDLRNAEVDTTGTNLSATIKVEDLELQHLVANDTRNVAYAWVYLFSDGQGQYNRYLAAISPVSQGDATKVGQFDFEWGETTAGTFETLTYTRRGTATGTVDMTKDTITISAPLATVGLTAGERVRFQTALSGGLLQSGLSKFSVIADAAPFSSQWRSYAVGASCPGSYA